MADEFVEDPDPSLRISAEQVMPGPLPGVTHSTRLLSQNVLNCISSVPGGIFTISQLKEALGEEKFILRRIYDILNVFEGIGLVTRVAKGIFRYAPIELPQVPPAAEN